MTVLRSTDISPAVQEAVTRLGRESYLAGRRYRPVPGTMAAAASEAGLLFTFELGCIYCFLLPSGEKLFESLDPEAAAAWIKARIENLT